MKPDAAVVSEIIEMAISDHVSFAQIKTLRGLGPDQYRDHGDTLGVNGQSVILFFHPPHRARESWPRHAQCPWQSLKSL